MKSWSLNESIVQVEDWLNEHIHVMTSQHCVVSFWGQTNIKISWDLGPPSGPLCLSWSVISCFVWTIGKLTRCCPDAPFSRCTLWPQVNCHFVAWDIIIVPLLASRLLPQVYLQYLSRSTFTNTHYCWLSQFFLMFCLQFVIMKVLWQSIETYITL